MRSTPTARPGEIGIAPRRGGIEGQNTGREKVKHPVERNRQPDRPLAKVPFAPAAVNGTVEGELTSLRPACVNKAMAAPLTKPPPLWLAAQSTSPPSESA
jgi:hypothetical protein